MAQDEWQNVIAESQRVLDLVMREDIRSNQVSLVQRQIRRFVSHALSDRQQTLVLEITQSMVIPNSFYDAQQTEASREAASLAVQPVQATILAGESILREGELVNDLAIEKLQVLGMLNAQIPWQDRVGLMLLSLDPRRGPRPLCTSFATNPSSWDVHGESFCCFFSWYPQG